MNQRRTDLCAIAVWLFVEYAAAADALCILNSRSIVGEDVLVVLKVVAKCSECSRADRVSPARNARRGLIENQPEDGLKYGIHYVEMQYIVYADLELKRVAVLVRVEDSIEDLLDDRKRGEIPWILARTYVLEDSREIVCLPTIVLDDFGRERTARKVLLRKVLNTEHLASARERSAQGY